MKFTFCLYVALQFFLTLGVAHAHAEDKPFPVLTGPYLGQTPPGMTPIKFAPGVISTDDLYEMNSVFSPDGTEFYYVISASSSEEKGQGVYFYYMMETKLKDGVWSKPKRSSFSRDNRVTDISISPDGQRLYFCGEQAAVPDYTASLDIWYVEREGDGWSEPVQMAPPLNSDASDTQPTFTNDGTMYFSSGRGDDGEIYSSRLVDGKYQEPVKLGENVNLKGVGQGNAFVAPDESYLLYARWGIKEQYGETRGLFISFKNPDGTWTKGKNVKPSTGRYGSLANLSHDGKYLFFSSDADIYWVDVRILEEMKVLK